jgi:MFS family permease
MKRSPWLSRTVLGVGLASLFCDWSQESVNAILPAFLASLGVSAAWLGLIEGISDGLASAAKLGSGYFTDKLPRRKPILMAGYTVSALGTAAIGLAHAPWQVLLARSGAWLGRGVRTPVRKALLAGAVERSAYGRAFGFERMMDTVGAVAGPASVFLVLTHLGGRWRPIFAWTLVPGLLAPAMIGWLARERERKPVPHISLRDKWRVLPSRYRQLLAGAGCYGAGRFAHTLLILLATRELTPRMGAANAAKAAVGLYILHNFVQAACGYGAGWLADVWPKKWLLTGGYLLGAALSVGIVVAPSGLGWLAILFIIGGIAAALEDTVEDAFCADLVEDAHQGTAFGILATVNGVGDFISSSVVGVLWSWAGLPVAFGYSAILALAGAFCVARVSSEPA